ncbi:MAG TPA: preprotein translocase subunit SecY [Desulfurococcaceae archaeon]|nr:preprotein translocase subunit SecY [Desulfurococcaceae archaeon]
MGILDVFARIGLAIPSAPRPAQRVPLGKRLLFTALVAMAYVALATTPLYGIETAGTRLPLSPIVSVVLAMRQGTLAQLGIGPIVTAGLILQILVGAKIIKLDLTDPESRRKFTLASKGLAVLLSIVEAAGFVLSGIYWRSPNVDLTIKGFVLLQLVWGAIIIIMLDEAVQKGWGLGSGISLFILLGVAQAFFLDLLSPFETQPIGALVAEHREIYGIIPFTIYSFLNGNTDLWYLFIGRGWFGYPTYMGLAATLALIFLLVYLSASRINVPITSPRLRGIRTRIPLQLLYVTNIPVLLTGILLSDINLFLSLAQGALGVETVNMIRAYLSPPSVYSFAVRPLQSIVYSAVFVALSIAFGIIWIEIAGLNPEAQAENLIRAGLEIPGMRRNPKILASYLARYIYPLTVFSSILVAVIALTGDIFRTFGTGTGLLLSVSILYNYYQMMVYERTLEMYPALKRLLGE